MLFFPLLVLFVYWFTRAFCLRCRDHPSTVILLHPTFALHHLVLHSILLALCIFFISYFYLFFFFVTAHFNVSFYLQFVLFFICFISYSVLHSVFSCSQAVRGLVQDAAELKVEKETIWTSFSWHIYLKITRRKPDPSPPPPLPPGRDR